MSRQQSDLTLELSLNGAPSQAATYLRNIAANLENLIADVKTLKKITLQIDIRQNMTEGEDAAIHVIRFINKLVDESRDCPETTELTREQVHMHFNIKNTDWIKKLGDASFPASSDSYPIQAYTGKPN